MGRRDAVQFVLEVVAEARRILPRLQVDFLDGWAGRGNGTSADYEGLLVHHTGVIGGSSQGNPFPTKNTLVNGRGGANPLDGPLCNFGGPWCTVEAPRLVVVAAHPANHAGASGGRSMGPLPVTKLFNPKVLGLEIDYAGTSPMTAGQLLVAQVLGRAVTNVLGRPSAEWVRAHYETSVTGKWDIGWAPSKSVDMAQFRAGVWNITTLEDDDMYDATARQELIGDRLDKLIIPLLRQIAARTGFPFVGFRSDPDQKEADGKAGDGSMVLAAPGYWLPVPGPGYVPLYQARGLVGEFFNVPPNEFRHFRDVFLAPDSGAVDNGKLAEALRAALPAAQAQATAEQMQAQAKVVADLIDARELTRLQAPAAG